jgi:hypothetical protein
MVREEEVTMIVRCRECGLMYCADLREDQALHRKRHRQACAIKEAHPDYEPDFHCRERLKHTGKGLEHIENVIRAHWSRSIQVWGSR